MHERERMTYIEQLTAFQTFKGFNNAAMAEKLCIGQRTYERFIFGDPIQRELDLILQVYGLNGRMMYLMTGVAPPREVENMRLYSQLSDDNKHVVDELLKILYETEHGAK